MIKSIFKFQLVTLLLQLVSFVTSIFIARLLNLEDRGILGQNILYVGLVLGLSNAGFNEYLARELKRGSIFPLKQLLLISAVVYWLCLYLLVICDIIVVGANEIVFLTFLIFPFTISNLSMTFTYFVGLKRIMNYGRLINVLTNPILICLIYLFGKLNQEVLFLTSMSATVVSSLFFLWYYVRNRLSVFKNLENLDFKILFYNFLTSVPFILFLNMDKMLLTYVLDKELFAMYIIAVSIFMPVVELLSSSASVINVELIQGKKFLTMVMKLITLYALIFLIIHFFLINLIPIIFGQKYSSSIELAKLFSGYFFLMVVYRIQETIIRINKVFLPILINLFFVLSISLCLFILSYQKLSEISSCFTLVLSIFVTIQFLFILRINKQNI